MTSLIGAFRNAVSTSICLTCSPSSLVAIYPIFIAVGLRQNRKQNYIFITVRLPYDVAKISPKYCQNLARIATQSRHNLARIATQSRQNLARVALRSRQNLARVALRSRQNLAKISPQLQYDVPKTGRIAIRSRHSFSRKSPSLAELQCDLATVALLCSQDSQDCCTISPQLNYDVPKTRRIAMRYRYSWTTMSLLRLAAWLLTTTLLATNFLLHQIKEKINITSY